MTVIALPPPSEPRWSDTRDRWAGEWSSACGTSKAVARALDLSVRRIQQTRAGHPPGHPQWLWEYVDRLITHPSTSPLPLILGILELVFVREYQEHSNQELLRAWGRDSVEEAEWEGRVRVVRMALHDETTRERLEAYLTAACHQQVTKIRLMANARETVRRREAA
jgi:hypothetical protein